MKVLVSPRARDDLKGIALEIGQHHLEAAEAFLKKLTARFGIFRVFPHVGTGREDLCEGLRAFSFRRYVIYFRILEDHVRIDRVLHGSRDIGPSFFA
jgi:toxin ParE1/3/4